MLGLFISPPFADIRHQFIISEISLDKLVLADFSGNFSFFFIIKLAT
jgi:hypothetical protein